MDALPLVCQILSRVEKRNQAHALRLYGTLARGSVWSCMNRVEWALSDLRRILRWGAGRGLIEKDEAVRLWHLVRMLVETAGKPATVLPRAGRRSQAVVTQLNVTSGMVHPWQEWKTEKLTVIKGVEHGN